jgi:hypothetical protein
VLYSYSFSCLLCALTPYDAFILIFMCLDLMLTFLPIVSLQLKHVLLLKNAATNHSDFYFHFSFANKIIFKRQDFFRGSKIWIFFLFNFAFSSWEKLFNQNIWISVTKSSTDISWTFLERQNGQSLVWKNMICKNRISCVQLFK